MFGARTLHVVSLDADGHRSTLGVYVLATPEILLTIEHHTRVEAERAWRISLPDYPDAWHTIRVNILRPATPWMVCDLLRDVTLTGRASLEAWGPRTGEDWPAVVAPQVVFEQLGGVASASQDAITMTGRLTIYPRSSGGRPHWSDGQRRDASLALPVEPGHVWSLGTTRRPPPLPGPAPVHSPRYWDAPDAPLRD